MSETNACSAANRVEGPSSKGQVCRDSEIQPNAQSKKINPEDKYWSIFVDDQIPLWTRIAGGALLPIMGPLTLLTACNNGGRSDSVTPSSADGGNNNSSDGSVPNGCSVEFEGRTLQCNSDEDRDGITNKSDLCPLEAGIAAYNGCNQVCSSSVSSVSLDCSNNEFQISQDNAVQNYGPSLGINSSGWSFVAWTKGDPTDEIGKIWARAYDAAGDPVSDEIQVSSDPDYAGEIGASVKVLDDGSFLVTWLQSEAGAQPNRLVAQKFSEIGAALGAVYLVNGSEEAFNVGGGQQGGIVFRSDGSYIVGSYDSAGQDRNFYLQVYDNNGNPISPANLAINADDYNDFFTPQVVTGPTGDFLLSWYLSSSPGSLFAKNYDASGNAISSAFSVLESFGFFERYDVTLLQSGNSVFVHYVIRESDAYLESNSFSREGVHLGSPQLLSDPEYGVDAIRVSTDGNLVVMGWQGFLTGEGDYLKAAVLSETGAMLVNPFKVNVTDATTLRDLGVTQNSYGHVVSVWIRSGLFTGETDYTSPRIVGRHFSISR